MSGSGKGLLGLWLYRSGEEWTVKEDCPIPTGSAMQPVPELPPTVPQATEHISIIFTLKNQVGGLVRALQAFQDLGINVLHIESRPSEKADAQSDILVDVECEPKRMEQLSRLLKREVQNLCIGTYGGMHEEFPPPTPLSATSSFESNVRYEYMKTIERGDGNQKRGFMFYKEGSYCGND